MRILYFLLFITGLSTSALAQYAPQDTPCMSATSSPGVFTLTYPSVAGRVYFLQVSTDLQTWNYCPVVQLGDGGIKPWLICSESSRAFARLEYSLDNIFTAGDTGDMDGDGLTNLAEITTHHTQPGNSDTDGDGYTDGEEITTEGTDPLKFDLPTVTVVTGWRKSSYTDILRRTAAATGTRTASAVGTGDGTSAGSKTNYYTWTNLALPTALLGGYPQTTSSASNTNWVSGKSSPGGTTARPIGTLISPQANLLDREIPAAWRLERLHGTSSAFLATPGDINKEQYLNIDATATILERIVSVKASRDMPKDWRVYYKIHNATQYGRDGVWAVIPGTLEYFVIPKNQQFSDPVTLKVTAASTIELPARTRTSPSAAWVNNQVYETRAIKWIEFTGRPSVPATGDADGDGLADAVEPRMGLSPTSLDTNGDGVSDGDALMPALIQPQTETVSGREVEYAWLADDPECPGHPARRIEVRPLKAGSSGLQDPMPTATGIHAGLQTKIDSLGSFFATPPAINIPSIPAATANYVIANGLSATMSYSKATVSTVNENANGTQQRIWAIMQPAPDAAATRTYIKLTEVTTGSTTTTTVTTETFDFAEDETTSSNYVTLQAPAPATATGSPQVTVKQSLLNVDIEPDANMAGVVGDVIKSIVPGSTIKHFVSPKKSTELPQDYVILKATGVTAAQITPGHASQVVEWNGGEATVPADPLKRRVRRDTAALTEVNLRLKNGGAMVKQMNVWVVWSQAATSATIPLVADSSPAGLFYIAGGYQFVFSITPSSITDPSVTERPDLTGPNTHNGAIIHPPGAEEAHIVDNNTYLKQGASLKWDVTRRMRVKILNPSLLPRNSLWGSIKPIWEGQPALELTRLDYPDPGNPPSVISNACKGNDDSDVINDEDNNPYQVSTLAKRAHQISQIASYDRPEWVMSPDTGALNDTFELRLHFGEFTRLLIGGVWYRTSDYFPWKIHMRYKKGVDLWMNNNSVLEINNNDW
jgi:Bacterial TSP3 repeat